MDQTGVILLYGNKMYVYFLNKYSKHPNNDFAIQKSNNAQSIFISILNDIPYYLYAYLDKK